MSERWNVLPDAQREAQIESARERAKNDALRSLLAELPSPEEYIYRMSEEMVDALMKAQLRRSTLTLPEAEAKYLRKFGLVDYRTCNLTAFGASIYRALREEES